MAYRDGTGPIGQGPGVGGGRGRGGCITSPGRGFRQRPRGFGGPAVEAVCPNCGTTVPKRRGIRCFQMKCPECGSALVRGR